MTSRLSQMQARFQQKQMQEKEEKLLKLYENQQQRAFDRVGRSSAGSNGNITTSTTTISTGKVRQMFDERRQKAGIDRSYPLEPLKTNRAANRAGSLDRKTGRTVQSTATVQKSMSTVRNGKPLVAKKEIINSIYNNNGEQESYEENRYVDDEADNYLREHGDIVAMMNKHNLNDSLEDEEMPHIGFDDYEEPVFTGKLANLGGKLPSEAVPVVAKKTAPVVKPAVKAAKKTSSPVNGTRASPVHNANARSPPKREVKPVLKSVAAKTSSPIHKVSTVHSCADKPDSTPTTPSKMTTRSSSGADRTPSASRPSARVPCRPPNNAVQRDDMSTCRFCQRRFAADRLQVHEDICSRTAKKKRKTYDATRHRLAGTELEPYVKKVVKGSSSKQQAKPVQVSAGTKNSNWRQKHEEFISAIRAAKQAQAHIAKGGNIRDLPPPPPSTNPDYVQCPHCGRRFNESAAERHIPKCASYQFNKPKPKLSKQLGGGSSSRTSKSMK